METEQQHLSPVKDEKEPTVIVGDLISISEFAQIMDRAQAYYAKKEAGELKASE